MARKKVKRFADLRAVRLATCGQRQMLFAGGKRHQVGMANDHTRGDAGIRRHSLVASVTRNYAVARPANHAGQNQRGRSVSVLAGELRETGGIAINQRSRGDAVKESPPRKPS